MCQAPAAEIVVESLSRSLLGPENLNIYVGDTVTFRSRHTFDAESYAGDWKSPILKAGQTFSYTFTRPGTNVYRSGLYDDAGIMLLDNTPGTIIVQPLTNSRPAISIVTPPDGFVVLPCCVFLMAAMTNAEASVKEVQFFNGTELIGTVTNTPYQIEFNGPAFPVEPVAYEFTAVVIDTAGQTNVSPPVRVKGREGVFNLWRTPRGETVVFFNAPHAPSCLQWSEDLKVWNDRRVRFGQAVGNSTFYDPQSTNAAQRFYRVVDCL